MTFESVRAMLQVFTLTFSTLIAQEPAKAVIQPQQVQPQHEVTKRLNAPNSDKPLEVGRTFTIESTVLNETRVINVYRPALSDEQASAALPVIYMLDGGVGEDFVHVMGLVQVMVGNGSIKPIMLVGIQNTQRRRDLTGPTDDPEDRKIAPVVGQSAPFRKFIKTELFPEITRRYQVSNERLLVGESLAGLFVMETLLADPEMFDSYIAIDPSVWWNRSHVVKELTSKCQHLPTKTRKLFLATSSEPSFKPVVAQLINELGKVPADKLSWQHQVFSEETHATIYHPAAYQAFRKLLKPN